MKLEKVKIILPKEKGQDMKMVGKRKMIKIVPFFSGYW